MTTAVGFYADDFTGATDALFQLARCGLHGVLLLRVDPDAVLRHGDRAVVGVAGISRSLPTSDMRAEVLPALTALNALEPEVLHYKACSTADSSPTTGSLGHAAALGRETTGQADVPVLLAQPDFGRYTAFATHFAADRGEVFRLDRHPTMSRHPSTPVDEADLRVFLARQTDLPVRSRPFTSYGEATPMPHSPGLTVLDALTDDHLAAAGELILDAPGAFAIGSGGLSRAVGLHLGSSGAALPTGGAEPDGVLVVSGSRSAQTGRQIDAAHAAGWPVRALIVDDLTDEASVTAWASDHLAGSGRAVVHSLDLPADVPGLLPRLAELYTALIGAVRVHRDPTVIVCGGDTSSRMLRLMGAESLEIDRHLTGNVVVSRLTAPGAWPDGLRVLLKGGQVGPVDLFARTLTSPDRSELP
ncbi:MAG TPA: four-carbon acid sugar kinase family protein [Arachnia sp.]|nr:four-carbon acid sugar kinase family protein [Arachnia sp.]